MELTECFNEDFMHNNIKNSELRIGFFSGLMISCAAFGFWELLRTAK